MKNKIICIILLIVIISVMLSACAANSDTSSVVTATNAPAEETVVTKATDTLPSKDFEQYEFKIIASNADNRNIDIISEQLDGSLLNDLIYERNSKIQEMYNIKLTTESFTADIASVIKKGVLADDNLYDIYFANALAGMMTMMAEGYLYPLNELPVADLSAEWWDQDAISGLSIGGNVYLATGDITPTGLMTSECLLFNKKLFDDYGIAYPYDTVLSGKWTWNELLGMTKDMTADLNGDNKISVKDDLFSYTGWHYDCADALFYGAGGSYTKKDANDIPALNFNIDLYSNIFDKMSTLLIDQGANFETTDHERSFNVFKEGRAYFCGIQFWKIELFLRDMKDDYGILPEPKLDESQDTYKTSVQDQCAMIALQKNCTDTERTGTILEAMAALNYDNITPKLYDVIASTRNVRDNESAGIVNLIIRNRVFDIGMYLFDDYSRLIITGGGKNIASFFAEKESAALSTLKSYTSEYSS